MRVHRQSRWFTCLLLLAPFARALYLDGCAGLGGKTLHLTQLLPEGAQVVAVEPNLKRQALLKDSRRRLGGPEIEIHGGTLQKFAEQRQGGFAGILIDAPCSGAAGLVEKGGLLVYATCSLDPRENDEVIAAFIQEHPEFSITPAQEHLPEAARGLCNDQGFLKTTPEQGLDGFFAARMERNG